MKRHILLACPTLCGAASAQSSVTIYGIADIMLTRGSGSLSQRTALASGKLSLGYVHNLSKRTALYGTIAQVSNAGGATFALNGSTTAANTRSRGLDLGIRHSF